MEYGKYRPNGYFMDVKKANEELVVNLNSFGKDLRFLFELQKIMNGSITLEAPSTFPKMDDASLKIKIKDK